MDEQLIQSVVEELAPALEGGTAGKVFQLARAAFAFDFRTRDGRYLYVSAEPAAPRLYLVARTVRELERQSLAPSPFALALRKHLSGATLRGVSKLEGERVVRFTFEGRDAAGEARRRALVAQLTGRSSNLFLLDEEDRIIAAARDSRGEGQEDGEHYAPPRGNVARAPTEQRAPKLRQPPRERGPFRSLSEALDEHFRQLEASRRFDARAAALRARLRQSLDKLRKLRRNLEQDLAAHGDAQEHKRAGDLLLANLATAERSGRTVRLTDYYADDAPTVELEVEENRTLQEEAGRRFARYAKARRAAQEIAERRESLAREEAALEAQGEELERIVAARDEAALEEFAASQSRGKKRAGGKQKEAAKAFDGLNADVPARREMSSRKATENIPGVRRYLSSDGYEILVGRGARDNDHLTFRVARSQDAWLHAADYPGSHVVVRNHKRGAEVPHRTLVEAAQLAAHFSQANKDSKVAVHHTQRKFVSKIKGGAPGLVRLSSFRTLMVEPRESVERI